MTEIEAQPLWGNQRAGLAHMLAQFFSQHGVKNMSR
jgi:hypothetical protein